MNDRMLSSKVIVVAGGAGLLGHQFCAAISDAGGVAVVADRDFDGARHFSKRRTKRGPGRVDRVEMDITDRDSIGEAIRVVAERYGVIDAVVNSAYPRNPRYGRRMEDVTYSDFCENLCMHLGGYFLVAQQFAAAFRTYGRGNIVNISSVYGVIAPRFEVYEGIGMTMPVEYAVIKAGVLHLTRYLAKYLKGSRVRVNAISPGGIWDNQPQEFIDRYKAMCLSKGMLDKSDINGTLLFLLSDASTFINGQNLIVDDGFSI